MHVNISVEYFTVPGESLCLALKGRRQGRIPMQYVLEGIWQASFEVPSSTVSLEYGFELCRGGRTIRTEWCLRKVAVPSGGRFQAMEIHDHWIDRPSDSPFWTKAFSDVIFGKKTVSFPRSGNLLLQVPCAQVRKGETLAVTGSGPMFEDWTKFEPLMLSRTAPKGSSWNIFLDASGPFEYKFVILDAASGKPKYWESGPNRYFAGSGPGDSCTAIVGNPPEFERQPWKGSGVAIPVFSLRSGSSFGVGEFNDLKKLVDWAVATGQSLIQLLPINDTTMTRTWTDSYPYNANSTFALHPQFISLPSAGVTVTKAYSALQKELNALPQIDYERVNNEKDRLLRKTFKASGYKSLESDAFLKFFKANSHWLVPYAVFCVLRDLNGTPEFGKWKELSEYSEPAVGAFREAHKAETDFYCWEQFCLDAQLKDAVGYAHSKGVAIKGDLPIGISRTSVDAWQYPRLFNLDSQAGAPPDAFSEDGQNWGFPTYNWEEMAKDGYAWWKARLRKMSEYFDAFRIDHILGFFRIWEIPYGIKSGLLGHFNPALPYPADELRGRGFEPESQLFVPDPHRPGWYHPRISSQNTADFQALDEGRRNAYNDLYNDFFYHRHNSFWKGTAMEKLPALLDSTSMMACGEDLGMIPACVPEVMDELKILSLEVQRMPKSPEQAFGEPWKYPYLSVCTTGSHDTSSLRAWWEEDRSLTERFFHEILHCEGQAPFVCEPWVCELILRQHLESPSMLCILPLQDWLSVDGEVRYQGDPADERINVPANPRHYWRWRMHLTLEELISRKTLNSRLREMVMDCQR